MTGLSPPAAGLVARLVLVPACRKAWQDRGVA